MSTVFADPLLSPATPSDTSSRRRRWEIWKSPSDQPPWARPSLLVIAAIAAALFAWNIVDAGLAPFYSVAVRSMSESWKAFFYGAFDPKATITIDKLAGSFLPQALSARIFGFHPWSLALPQVIEGVISVLAMYRMVRRWAGAAPGLLAAALFALTPIAASMFGHSMEDGALTMCLVLAADQWTRSVTEGRLRSLLWAGFWIGAGFQCKMLQAWMVLPALIIAYLFCASGSWGRRVRDLVLFGVVTLATSLSWILLYTFTPAADRPYVDGSTNNSAWSMVFGYNGLERFGISVPGSVTSGPGVSGGAGTAPKGMSSSAAEAIREVAGFSSARGGSSFGSGWTKLLGSEFGPQIGWLFPLTLLALVCGLLWTWRSSSRTLRAGFVMWGLWFVTFFLIFSDMSDIPHTAYVASLAPAIAALSAVGIVMFWRLYRAGDRRGWILPISVAVSLAWAVFLWRSYSGFLPWALWIAVAVGVIAIAMMIWARVAHRTTVRIATVGLIAGIAAMVAPGAAWAASVLDSQYAGSSFNAGAGPDSGMGGGAGGPGGAGGFGGHGMSSAMREEFAKMRFGASGAAGSSGASGGGFPGGAPGGAPGGSSGGGFPGGAQGGAPGSSGSSAGGAPGGAPGGASGGGFPGFPGGSSSDGSRGAFGRGGFGGRAGGAGGGGMMGATQTLTSSEREIYDYVNAHRGGASYLMAVSSWSEASPYILSTGQEVMSMGGFSGSVPSPTLTQVQKLVSSGQLKFFLLNSTRTSSSSSGSSGSSSSSASSSGKTGSSGQTAGAPGGGAGFGGGGMFGGSSSALTSVQSWVEKTCTAVPAKDYGGSSSTSAADVLYECKG